MRAGRCQSDKVTGPISATRGGPRTASNETATPADALTSGRHEERGRDPYPVAGLPFGRTNGPDRIRGSRVIRRTRDFSAFEGDVVDGGKQIRVDGDPPCLIVVRPTTGERLFFDRVEVTLLFHPDPASLDNPVITVLDSGRVSNTDLRRYLDIEPSRQHKQLPSQVAKAALEPLWEKFPPLLSERQIEEMRRRYTHRVESQRIVSEDRPRLDKNRLILVLKQYDENKGAWRRLSGNTPFVEALSGFVTRIAGDTLTESEIDDLRILMLKFNDVMTDVDSLSAEIYTELTKAIASATDDAMYETLLPTIQVPGHFKFGVETEKVFIDSDGQAHDVAQVSMLLGENLVFRKPDGTLFKDKDIARLCANPLIRDVLEGIENNLRNQKGRVSGETLKQVRGLIGPMDGYNKGPEGPKQWSDAAVAFSDYVSRLGKQAQEDLWNYRISIATGVYTMGSGNTTFRNFFDTTVRECNNQSAGRLREIVNLMSAGTGGEAEADRWHRLQESARKPRIEIPEYTADPTTTAKVLASKK